MISGRGSVWCRIGAAGAVVLLAFGAPHSAARAIPAMQADPSTGPLTARYVDYTPEGMPDFSQCRGAWSRPGEPGQWTHAGPVALAEALWWLDSVAEPGLVPPPGVSDGHSLVTAYPQFGPPRDDHAASNIGPLVDDLALRANTNGVREAESLRGTRWEDLVEAAGDYVAARQRAAAYRIMVTSEPDAEWLGGAIAAGGAIVVALGIWEERPDGPWARVGGHYASVAGWDAAGQWIDLADPLADAAAFGGAGRAVPDDPAGHGCREAPRAHDDAAFVSHDRYHLRTESGLPGRRQILADYFTPDTFRDAAAFAGQNPLEALVAMTAPWQRTRVVASLDAALAVLPRSTPTITPEPSKTASPTRTATAATDVPTASTPTVVSGGTPTVATPSSGTVPSVTTLPAGSTPARRTAGPFGAMSAFLPLAARSR